MNQIIFTDKFLIYLFVYLVIEWYTNQNANWVPKHQTICLITFSLNMDQVLISFHIQDLPTLLLTTNHQR